MYRVPLYQPSLLLLLIFMFSPAIGQAAELTFEDLFDTDFDGRIAEDLEWRPDSDQLRLTWDGGDGDQYLLIDAKSGEHQVLATPDELRAGAKDSEAKIDDLRFMPRGDGLLYAVDGDLFRFDIEERKATRLTTTASDEEMANPSPDGGRLAYVRDNDLYILDLSSNAEHRLTQDGVPDVIYNGTTDWVYWEEIWGRDATGSWWSDDGQYLAYYHMDDREVSVYPLVDTSSVHPEVEMQRYPKSGDVLPKVEVRVYDVAAKKTVTLATGDDPDVYLARVHWRPDGKSVVVERLNRDQTQIDLLLCQAADGSCSIMMSETWPTWVNLGSELTFLSDGRFIWSSEKSGWKQLYLHGQDGKELRQLTHDGVAVTSLDLVDEGRGEIVYTAYSTGTLGASERHVFARSMDGGDERALTSSAGWHGALASTNGYWVHTSSDANTPPRKVIQHLRDQGTRNQETSALPHAVASDRIAELPAWRFFTLAGPEGSQLPAQMMVPADLEPGRRYPVLMYHYGGPASQVVANRWRDDNLRGLWHKYLASRGYVLLSVDNQASSFFGKAGEDRLHRRFGEVELAGQLAGVEYLKTLPWVDSERIGLWGWSGGGSHTLYSLLRRPGVWKAGISGAPVTDWRFYDAIWMERYLDLPSDNAMGYEASSPITYAAHLQDALLVIHGTADNNVHPQNSINLASAFIEAGVTFDLAIYPGASHSFRSFKEAGRRHLIKRMTDFFDRHLLQSDSVPSSNED